MDPGNCRKKSDQKWWQLGTKVRMSNYDSQVIFTQELSECARVCIWMHREDLCLVSQGFSFFQQLLFKILACCVHLSSVPHIWKDC